MTKSDIVTNISEKTGIPKVDILVTLETFFREVKYALVEGEPVYVRGFGSFVLKKRAAKLGRHIKRNEILEIPEHFFPTFRPSKEFVQAVKDQKVDTNERFIYESDEEA